MPGPTIDARVREALAWLSAQGTAANRAGLARFGITAQRTFGVSMTTMRPLARRLGRDHALALALWDTGWHEARLLATLVGDAAALTDSEMDRWCEQFDNWAICDSACMHLFSRSPLAWTRIRAWVGDEREFVRRGGFAMLASLALRRSRATDDQLLAALDLIEAGAADSRNFVKKGVNWALRQIGKRNLRLNGPAVDAARRLASSPVPSARWIGKDALRELTSPAVVGRLRARAGVS